jgi:hypothetical protein
VEHGTVLLRRIIMDDEIPIIANHIWLIIKNPKFEKKNLG